MHTIHDITFEVDVNYDNQLIAWEQYYVDFFQDTLLPRVEVVCDDWDQKFPNTKCTIDTIEITVETDDINLAALQKEIMQQIHQQLMSIQADGSSHDGKITASLSREASPFDALISYMKNGILPGYISVKVFKEWLHTIVEFTSVENNKLIAICTENTEALERLLSLLQNDYVKLAKIIRLDQQLTAQYIKLERVFFAQFLKAICENLQLHYDHKQMEIWYQTSSVNSSLPQFSKTFLQLLTPKIQVEGKRLIRVNQKQVSILLIQAILQYKSGTNIKVDTSKIGTIINDVDIQSEAKKQPKKDIKTNTSKQTETTKNTLSKTSKSVGEKQQIEENISSEKQNKIQQSEHKTSIANNKENSKANTNTSQENRSNLAEANIYHNKTTDITITTEKAGLILLHPFLMTFLKGVKLVSEDKTINDFGKACMLLHYIATETETASDIEFTLEKILLGIPLETFIDYDIPLSEHDKKLCEELLKAVLEHWVVLKKSTINTLRDMFLKREGTIMRTKDSINIKIERAAQDILLEKIPWNISLIRLRWMEKMMHVEW